MKKTILFLALFFSSAMLFAEDYDLSRLSLTDDVFSTTLANGLQVIIKEEHSTPMVAFGVAYKVGFRDEDLDGRTGLTHLLEHMMFKGSVNYPEGSMDEIFHELGASYNAYTTWGVTFYHEVLPAGSLSVAIDIEADRMTNAIFDPDDFASETSVVLSELNSSEDDPWTVFAREFYPLVFGEHPITYMAGLIEDVENAERDYVYNDLYKTYYVPNNAIVLVVGDVDTEEALSMVEESFGKIPQNEELPTWQAKPIDFVSGVDFKMEGEASEDFGTTIFDLPAVDLSNDDYIALAFLNYSGMIGEFGYWDTTDFGLGWVDYTEEPTYPAETVDFDYIRDNFEDFKSMFYYDELLSYDTVGGIRNGLLGFALDMGYENYSIFLEKLMNVTADDVIDVIEEYLCKENSSTGFFEATEINKDKIAGSSDVTEEHASDVDYSGIENPTQEEIFDAMARFEETLPSTIETVSNYFADVEKRVLDNGITVLYRPFTLGEGVSIHVSIDAGSVYQNSANQADWTASFVFDGGPQSELLNDLALLGTWAYGYADWNGAYYVSETLPENFGMSMEALALALKDREFVPVLVEEKQFLALNGLELAKNDTDNLYSGFYRLLYNALGGEAAALNYSEKKRDYLATELEDLKDFYVSFYRPENMVISVVGNIDSETVFDEIESALGNWQQEEPTMEAVLGTLEEPKGIESKTLNIGALQAYVFQAFPAVSYSDETNFAAFAVANSIFGGGGFTSRLMRSIRDEAGLSYGVYSFPKIYGDESLLVSYMMLDPSDIDLGIEMYENELSRFIEEGPSELELIKTKINFLNSQIGTFSSASEVASQLSYYEMKRGSYDYLTDYFTILSEITMDDIDRVIEDYFSENAFRVISK